MSSKRDTRAQPAPVPARSAPQANRVGEWNAAPVKMPKVLPWCHAFSGNERYVVLRNGYPPIALGVLTKKDPLDASR